MRGSRDRHFEVEVRRTRERRVWWLSIVLSVFLHLLVLLLWPVGRIPLDSLATFGPEQDDDRAAHGVIEILALSSAPPEVVQPTPVVVPEVFIPLPVPSEPEPPVEVELPPVPEPGVGTTIGDAPADVADAGAPDAAGAGAGGPVEEGVARLVPPSPRGMIMPPTNRELRGREIEVWVFVDERGRVVPDSTQLRPPTSDRRFNEQLVREAGQWVFEPARENGAPVAAWFPYRIAME